MSTVDLQLTGAAILVVETTRGPMELSINDLPRVRAMLAAIVDGLADDMVVGSMNGNRSRSLKRQLKAIGGG